MEKKEMDIYKGEVFGYVKKYEHIFNTSLTSGIMDNISILCDKTIVDYFKTISPYTGFSFKEVGDVKNFEEYISRNKLNYKVKQYDIFIDLENIRTSVNKANESKIKEITIQEDVAIKSLITHELMHSISRGFVIGKEGNWLKDEAYTDYYAKIVFESICSGEVYFTPYDFLEYVENGCNLENQKLFKEYSEYYQQIEKNTDSNYFQKIKE